MEKLKKEKLTITLIIINVIFYFYQTYLGIINPELQLAFMIDNSIHLNGSIKTLITSMFIHMNIMHIGMNMLGLYFLGSYLERRISEKKYFMIYFISGLTASIFSFLYIVFISNQIVLGASGAIFGLWAYYSLYREEFNEFLLIAGITNIAMIAGGLPIAWYAHLGGTIAGIILWEIEKKKKKKTIFKMENFK